MRLVVVRVEVAGNEPGSLEVSWELTGDGPVELAVGPSPGSIDHGHPVARVEGETRISLRGLGRVATTCP